MPTTGYLIIDLIIWAILLYILYRVVIAIIQKL